jgi:hypothetical protein
MDATDWGEVLVLSGALYLQGIDERYDGDVSGQGNDTCGQSIVADFVEKYNANDTYEPPNPYHVDHPDFYQLDNTTWNQIWTYRRILSHGSKTQPNDLTLQNWQTGNDYVFGYLFLSKNESEGTLSNWTGGIDLIALDGAERLADGFHYWFKKQNTALQKKITMDKEAFGTCHGLAKLPYIRDTRRSIGLDNFIMKLSDIIGKAEDMTGKVYLDRVAIGAYNADIHPLDDCSYPAYMNNSRYIPVLPYFIPLRAMTNANYSNLLVAGKTMAQSFLVNSATRLHPVEWSSGTSAGVVASFMSKNNIDTRRAVKRVEDIRTRIVQYTPTQWTINGKKYPPDNNLASVQ